MARSMWQRNVILTATADVIRDSVTYTEHAKRKTVTALDVVYVSASCLFILVSCTNPSTRLSSALDALCMALAHEELVISCSACSSCCLLDMYFVTLVCLSIYRWYIRHRYVRATTQVSCALDLSCDCTV